MRCLKIPTFAALVVATLSLATAVQAAPSAAKRVAVFSGHNAPKSRLRTTPLAKPSGHIHLAAENLAEDIEVDIYKPDGSFDDAALAKLDELFRCAKTGEVRAVRRELYEQL